MVKSHDHEFGFFIQLFVCFFHMNNLLVLMVKRLVFSGNVCMNVYLQDI